jgi:hypothetical protein
VHIDDVVSAFAAAIFAKVAVFSAVGGRLTGAQRARILESISDDIKKLGNFVVHDVSEAAHDEATTLEIDLREMTWHDQSLLGPAPSRRARSAVIPRA